MDETQSQLIAEQLSHLRSNIQARLDIIEREIRHTREMQEQRNALIDQTLAQLRSTLTDHETRIRANAASATRSTTWQSIISAVGTAIAIAALIKAFGL